LRDANVADLTVNFDSIRAGGNIGLLLQSSVKETPVTGNAGSVLINAPGDAYSASHYTFFKTPDSTQGPAFTSGVLVTDTQVIAGSYVFRQTGLVAGGNIAVIAANPLAADPVINISANTDVLGSGHIDALTHGNIVITETAGDLRIGTLQANAGDVSLTSATGSIVDIAVGADNGSTPWVLADGISLTALNGGIGMLADFLEIDSSRSADALVDAKSRDSVFLRETAGDLRLGGIASLGQDVVLITLAGSLLDGAGDAKADIQATNIDLVVAGGSIGSVAKSVDIYGAGFGQRPAGGRCGEWRLPQRSYRRAQPAARHRQRRRRAHHHE
jgi:hypothetical protein